ncbi:unnamed protein product [Urochloa decumbens]|uniref:Uncharacterized protein n=1 Tax=Urochloa decumbens TaxID=240449 RepID=A0ABC9CYR5_9POAL
MALNSHGTKIIVCLATSFVVLAMMSSTFPSCQAAGKWPRRPPPQPRPAAPPPPFCFQFDAQYCTNYHCGKACQEHSFPRKNGGYCDKNVEPWQCCCPY